MSELLPKSYEGSAAPGTAIQETAILTPTPKFKQPPDKWTTGNSSTSVGNLIFIPCPYDDYSTAYHSTYNQLKKYEWLEPKTVPDENKVPILTQKTLVSTLTPAAAAPGHSGSWGHGRYTVIDGQVKLIMCVSTNTLRKQLIVVIDWVNFSVDRVIELTHPHALDTRERGIVFSFINETTINVSLSHTASQSNGPLNFTVDLVTGSYDIVTRSSGFLVATDLSNVYDRIVSTVYLDEKLSFIGSVDARTGLDIPHLAFNYTDENGASSILRYGNDLGGASESSVNRRGDFYFPIISGYMRIRNTNEFDNTYAHCTMLELSPDLIIASLSRGVNENNALYGDRYESHSIFGRVLSVYTKEDLLELGKYCLERDGFLVNGQSNKLT